MLKRLLKKQSKKQILTDADVMQALRSVDGLQLDQISGIQITDSGDVLFVITVDPNIGAECEPLRQKAQGAVEALPAVQKVQIVMTAEKAAQPKPKPATANAHAHNPDPHNMGKNPRLDIAAKKIIAVASGKGGVGKSMVAAHLAKALSVQGKTVGLLDADIYGPSIPKALGIEDCKPVHREASGSSETKLGAIEKDGIKIMSMGLLIDKDAPMVWRGPMAQQAFYQMLRDVDWAPADDPLDYLIIDMPPGTGDIQLTLAQKVDVAGAVIVSTPQDIALIDARKAITMFQKVDVPILGIIENMSYYHCPSCGHEDSVFGHGGAEEEAKRAGVPFLGAIPLNANIRAAADQGKFDQNVLSVLKGMLV